MRLSPEGSFLLQLRRATLLNLAFLLLALIVAYKIAGYIVLGDTTSLAYSGLAVAGGAAAIGILIDWRKGLYFLLAWLMFEDLARKFLGNNMVIYFAKDALLAVIYLSFFISWRRKEKDIETFRPPFLPSLLLLVWFGVIQIFNPGSTSIFYGLLGIKLYFYYVPLIFIGYALIKSEDELRKFFYINLGLMLIIALLGIAQSIIGPRFLNPAVMASDIQLLSETYRVAPISGARIYRPTSVFVSTGRFGDLLIVAWFLVFGFGAYLLLRDRRGRLFALLALSVTVAACVMCGSRGTLMWSIGAAIIGTAAFIWGAPWRQGEVLRVFRNLQRVALGIALAAAVMFFAYPEAFLSRLAVYSETLDPRSPSSELLHRARDYPMKNFLAAFDYERWPYGYGIGTLSLGGQYVSRFFHTHQPVGGIENGFGIIIVEMGILGLILWIAMSVAIVRSAWRVARSLKGSPWFPLAFMIALYAFVLLLPMTYAWMTGYQDFIMNAYLWLLVGILFRLPKLALAAQTAGYVPVLHRAPRWVR